MSIKEIKQFDDGYVIWGDFPSDDIIRLLTHVNTQLVIIDPDYEKLTQDNNDMEACTFMCKCMKLLEGVCNNGSSAYIFGDMGDCNCRPFYRLIIKLESCTNWRMINKVIWKKRIPKVKQLTYDVCYEEIAIFVLGDDVTGKLLEPKIFNTQYLDKQKIRLGKRNVGENSLCKRNNVWIDVSEMIRNKISKKQKPEKLIEIPILAHTSENDYIFDPFSRHGTTAIVAKKNKRRFIVVEKDRAGFDMCVNELMKLSVK
jgi:DNA modification methylase